MRVENLLPGVVARRVPERPGWVAANQRDPRVAARVYGTFALGFSTLCFGVGALAAFDAAVLLFVPIVVANAAAWTWLVWALLVPATGVVSRRRTLGVGLAIGTLSWLTVGPLMLAGTTAYALLTGTQFQTLDPVAAVLALGLLYSFAGFVVTLGIPTVASVGLALWTLDYEERSGREKRESDYEFA